MAYTSSSMVHSSEIDSLELVSLYIKNYKSLKNIHINLNPRFNTNYDDSGILHIDNRPDYLRKEIFSNVKLLCGENGVGKTSVLELLRQHNLSKDNILVMKTTSDKFVSNQKVTISFNGTTFVCDVLDYEFKFGEMSISQSALFEDGMNFRRYLLDFYIREKKLFDDIDMNLFTHFEITHWTGEELSSQILDGMRRNLLIASVESFNLDELRQKDLLSYLFYRHFGDSSFKDWVDYNAEKLRTILRDLNEYNVAEILIQVRKFFYNPPQEDRICKIVEKIESIVEKEYPIEKYNELLQIFIDFESQFNEAMIQPYRDRNVHQWGDEVSSVFYFRGYKKIGSCKRYLEELSSGEFFSIRNRCHLYAKMLQSDSSIILEDEPDAHLHPEWARLFVKNFFDTVVHIRKYLTKEKDKKFKTKIYNFVLTTHSPLILSDFFNEEVVFFQKKGTLISINDSTNNCFAGNIGSMLTDNFFLSKSIGAYSESKINEIIKIMDRTNKGKLISDDDKRQISIVISKIGDKLLRRLLEDKFERALR